MRRIATVVLFLLLAPVVFAARAEAPATTRPSGPVGFDSPRSTMFTFLEAMNRVNADNPSAWKQAVACFDFSKADAETGQEIARQTYEILNRIGEVKPTQLPDSRECEQAGLQRFQFFPATPALPNQDDILRDLKAAPPGFIAFAPGPDGRWLFSARTVERLPALYSAMQTLPDRYVGGTAAWLATLGPTFAKTPWWGWGFLLIAIFCGLAVGKPLQIALRSLAERWRKSHGLDNVHATIAHNAANPLSLLFLAMGIQVGLQGVHMNEALRHFSDQCVKFLYILSVGWFLFNLVDVVEHVLRKLTARTESKLDDMMVPLIRKTLRVFLVIIFTLVVAQNVFGLNITGWLAGLGIAGLAVSLAAQDSVKNLFGSVTVFFDKPFAVGDFISFDGQDAVVEEIGFRSTKMRTLDGHVVTVPNMKFIDQSVRNITMRPSIRRILDVTITYDTPRAKIELAVQIIKDILAQDELSAAFDLEKYPPRVFFNDYNAASLNIRVIYWYMMGDGRGYWSYMRHAEQFNFRLFEAYAKAGIEFAFPTQTLYLAGDANRPLSVGTKTL